MRCEHIYLRGDRKGDVCDTFVKIGELCSKHKPKKRTDDANLQDEIFNVTSTCAKYEFHLTGEDLAALEWKTLEGKRTRLFKISDVKLAHEVKVAANPKLRTKFNAIEAARERRLKEREEAMKHRKLEIEEENARKQLEAEETERLRKSASIIRKQELTNALTSSGCELRRDSRLCSDYIENGYGNLQDIVTVMVEMKFYFQKTTYSIVIQTLMNSYNYHYNYHYNSDSDDYDHYDSDYYDSDSDDEVYDNSLTNMSIQAKDIALRKWIISKGYLTVLKQEEQEIHEVPASLISKIRRVVVELHLDQWITTSGYNCVRPQIYENEIVTQILNATIATNGGNEQFLQKCDIATFIPGSIHEHKRKLIHKGEVMYAIKKELSCIEDTKLRDLSCNALTQHCAALCFDVFEARATARIMSYILKQISPVYFKQNSHGFFNRNTCLCGKTGSYESLMQHVAAKKNKIILKEPTKGSLSDICKQATTCIHKAATKIQEAWRRCIGNPNYNICIARLKNEFHDDLMI